MSVARFVIRELLLAVISAFVATVWGEGTPSGRSPVTEQFDITTGV